MSKTVTIYMPLLNEGTDCWRPVKAECVAGDRYLILGPVPEGEEWAFTPGTVVQGFLKTFSGGEQGVVAAAISN